MDPPSINLSLDGVQECNSSNASIDVFCVNFKNCRNIYPIKLIRPNNRFKYDEQEEIKKVINDIKNANISIYASIFDNPKRSVAKNVKCHSSTFACEYCEASAERYINDTMTKHKLTWPPSTMNGRPRTITAIRRIVNSIENEDEDVTSNYLKGIKGRSVFMDLPNFDLILDMPTEYMHLVCLGLVKKMLEYTYKIGEKRDRITTRKRSDPKLFNDLIHNVQVTRECSRRVRNLDTANFKAQEYRNTLLFFFPIVLENIRNNWKKERQLWLTLVFVIRSCVIPNEEFDHVSKETIVSASELYYNLFHELYGQKNCIYSLHVSSSHILKMRGNVPLTERSAFRFESFYSEMKNLFKSGTKSPLKQILLNTIMKRKLEHHTCEKSIFYSEKNDEKKMENNSLIYTFDNNEHNLYVITKIQNENEFICKRHGKFNYQTPLLPNYNWKSVGVFRKGPIGPTEYTINKNDIKGKVFSVLNMLITCPINVLNEK